MDRYNPSSDPRKYTNHLLNMVINKEVDELFLIKCFCKYMSEDQVQDMMEHNGIIDSDQLDMFDDED